MKNTKTWKRLTAGALALLVVAGTMPAGVNFGELIGGQSIVASAAEEPPVESGNWGSITWSLAGNGDLTLSGSGVVPNSAIFNNATLKENAKRIIIADDSNITGFSDNALFSGSAIEEVYVQNPVSFNFDYAAVSDCTNLKKVTIKAPIVSFNNDIPVFLNSTLKKLVFESDDDKPVVLEFKYGGLNLPAGTTVILPEGSYAAKSYYTFSGNGAPDAAAYLNNFMDGTPDYDWEWRLADALERIMRMYDVTATPSPMKIEDITEDNAGKYFGDDVTIKNEDDAQEVTYEKVEAKDPTPTADGNIEYYLGSDGNFYSLNNDGETYTKYENKDDVLVKMTDFHKVDEVPATPNNPGVKEHYEGTVNGETWYYTGGMPEDALSGDVNFKSLAVEKVITKGSVIYADPGDGGMISFDGIGNEFVTNDPDGLGGYSEYTVPEDAVVYNIGSTQYDEKVIYLKKYEPTYTKTTADDLKIEKETPEKVEAKDPTPTEDGNIEYYKGSDGNYYKLEEDGTTYTKYDNKDDVVLAKISVNKVEAKDPTPTEEGNIEYYEGSDGNFYSLNNDGETYTKYENKDDVVLAKITVTKVESKDPTVNETGNVEYYEGSDGNFYSLNDDGETYTKYENKNDVVLAKIAVTKVDKVDPTVNDTGMEAHYEATIGGEKKCYTATLPENAISGEVSIESLTEGTIIAPGTRIFTADSGLYEVFFDGENAGVITYDNSFTTTTESYVEVDGLSLGKIYDIDPLIIKSTPTLRRLGSFIKLKTYDLTYNEVDEQTLVIDKIETTKVEAVEPTCTATGNIEYYTDPDDNIYVLEDGKYVASSLEKVTLDMLPYDHVEANEPTCDTDGNKEYWYDKFEDKYYLDEEGKEEVDADYVVIPATGHKYSATWKWAKDYSAATVTLKCLNDPDEEPIVLNAEITEERVESTCKTQGKITYFAKASYNNVDYTYPKTVKLPLGDHVYGEPEWQWIDKNNVKATFTCTECGKTETVDATIRTETVAPTLTSAGKITYIASVTMQDKTYVDTRVQKLAKLPEAPTVTYTPGTGSVKLDWTAVDGAEKYAVCGEVDGKWQKLGSGTDTTFALYDLTSGKQYKVAVIAKVNGEWIEDYSKAIVVTPKVAANKYPKVSSIDYNDKYHQFRLNWDAVDGAQQYGVAVFIANKWKIVTQDISANTTNFTSPKLKAGQTYKMVVCAKIDGKWDTSNLTSRAFSVTVK